MVYDMYLSCPFCGKEVVKYDSSMALRKCKNCDYVYIIVRDQKALDKMALNQAKKLLAEKRVIEKKLSKIKKELLDKLIVDEL